MRYIETGYENNDQLAHAIQRSVDPSGSDGTRLTLRPFNRFDTDFTEWWFVPSTDWPSYKYGKILIRRYPRKSGSPLLLGYHVEKGLDKKLEGLPDVDPAKIMRADWIWNIFLENARGGEYDVVANSLSNELNIDVTLLVEIHEFNHAPVLDEPRPDASDQVRLTLSPGMKKFEPTMSSDTVLSPCNNADNISDCVFELSQIDDLEYYWLDLNIAITALYGSDSPNAFTAEKIWDFTLSPWLPWVK